MKFRVHTALHEESSNGWIWASSPRLRARSIVRITNVETRLSIHCEYREIDSFFLARFNRGKPEGANEMTMKENPIAISLWYRAALGISEIGKDIDLEIEPEGLKWFGVIRAGSQHPDVIARLATRLGVLGVWLGVTSIFVSLLSFASCLWFRVIAISFVAIAALMGFFLTKGVRE